MTELIHSSDGNIAEFYRGQNILVTGATGFVGKVRIIISFY
jgi:FlaA1/EpsC-like NDP-sugar epimerase